MDYHKIECNGYNIHLIKNHRFHTTECKVCFTENANKELITYRNALINVLTYATKNYDSKEKLIKFMQKVVNRQKRMI